MTARGASEFEIKPIRSPKSEYDVAILGGGLAGLTLALHLKRARPETSVLVAEKRELPPPEAAFKVGESTVEVGAFYYRELCGMADHLEQRHLRKAGLRFFFPPEETRTSHGGSSSLPPTSTGTTRSTGDGSRTRRSTARSSWGPTPSGATG